MLEHLDLSIKLLRYTSTLSVGIEGMLSFADDNFKVGLDLKISMEIRPRSQSGVLLSVTSSKGDYLIIQMINGVVSSVMH